MKFSRIALLLVALTFTFTALGQDTCSIKLADSPEVRGFKLWQEFESLRNRVPDSPSVKYSEPDDYGFQRANFYRFHLKDDADFKNVERVDLHYLDSKLVYIEIKYDSSVKWKSDLEFTAAIAEGLKLPTKGWRGHSPTRLDCEGFIVETQVDFLGSTLVIRQVGIEEEIAKRRKEANDKKRQTFKP